MASEGARPPRSPQPTFYMDNSDFYRAPNDSNEHIPRSRSPSIFAESEAQQQPSPTAEAGTSSPTITRSPRRLSSGPSALSTEAYKLSDAYRGTNEPNPNGRLFSSRASSSTSLGPRHSYAFRTAYPPSSFPETGTPPPTSFRSRRPSSEAMEAPRPFRPIPADSSLTVRSPSTSSFARPSAPWMRQESEVGSWSSAPATPPPRLGTPRSKKPFTSNLLKGEIEKPWLNEKDKWATMSWWITFFMIVIGFGVSAVYCFFQYRSIPQLGNMCVFFFLLNSNGLCSR